MSCTCSTENERRICEEIDASLPAIAVRPLQDGLPEIFIRNCFIDLLYRCPTPEEMAQGLQTLGNGTKREEFRYHLANTVAAKEACLDRPLVMALQREMSAPISDADHLSEESPELAKLLKSAEDGVSDIIERAYQVILRRRPAEEELGAWRHLRKNGLSAIVLIWAILHSEENIGPNGARFPRSARFAEIVRRKANLKQLLLLNGNAFVELSYQMFMGRGVTEHEKTAYAKQIGAGWTPADYLWRMVRRGEFAAQGGRRRMVMQSLCHPLTVGRWSLFHLMRMHLLRRTYRTLHAHMRATLESLEALRERHDQSGHVWRSVHVQMAEQKGAINAQMQAIHQSLNELREGTLDAQMQAIRQSLDELRQDYLRLANDCAASNSQMAQRHDALRQDLANHPRRYGQLVDDNVVLVEHPLGWVFGIPAENWAVVQLYTHETGFERGTINVLSSLCQKGMTVVDIGAHVGLHSLILASRAGKEGRIHCFEPCARSCKILRRNLFINGFSNVNVHQVALSDRNGISTFFEFNEELTWSSLYPPAGLESCTQVRVETACLDEVLPEDVKVDLVKLDAEGAELDILRGMKRIIARSPRIQIIVEFGPSNIVRAGNRPEDLLQLIREFGFSMQCIDEATGQLSPAKIDELPSVQSVNLLLSRPESA